MEYGSNGVSKKMPTCKRFFPILQSFSTPTLQLKFNLNLPCFYHPRITYAIVKGALLVIKTGH